MYPGRPKSKQKCLISLLIPNNVKYFLHVVTFLVEKFRIVSSKCSQSTRAQETKLTCLKIDNKYQRGRCCDSKALIIRRGFPILSHRFKVGSVHDEEDDQ